jgi:FkbM family methyltransferase
MNGVVQVGAHAGEEVNGWLDEGRNPIYCFEPQTGIKRVCRESDDVIWVPIALGYYPKLGALRIPRRINEQNLDTQSASFLELIPERAREIGWTPTEIVAMCVQIQRFDTWAIHNRYIPGECSLLQIDVQGFEGQVIEGFGDFIDDFEEIVVECSETPFWEYGWSTKDIEVYLLAFGFSRRTPIVKCGDVRFAR